MELISDGFSKFKPTFLASIWPWSTNVFTYESSWPLGPNPIIPFASKVPIIYVTNVNGIFLTHICPVVSDLSFVDWCKHILSVYSIPSKSTFPKI